MKLSACGHRFPAGHRLRVSIGTAYWPIVWPAPEAATLTLETAACSLHLPERKGGDSYNGFDRQLHGPRSPISVIRPAKLRAFRDHRFPHR